MKSFTVLVSLVVLSFLTVGNVWAQADTVGGPYTVDANTVVLFHFDGNLTNAAAAVGKTDTGAVPHTTIPNGISFVPNVGVSGGMGQCVRINNGAITDSSFLTLAETSAVDLAGSWTIEAWANILTFGSSSTDWRWVPRVVMKPGVDIFYCPNYWMEMWGDSRTFQTGFYTTAGNWISGTSPINMFVPGEWVHLTFIRDTTRGIIVQMVHDANRNLKSFTSTGFNPASDIPRPTLNPVHMGWAGGILNLPQNQSVDSWLDGYIDEIRISNIVRNFAGPPLITNTLALPNQPTSATSYQVTSKIQPFTAGATIASSTLHYYVTTWDSVAMTGAGVTKSGTIPQQTYGKLIKYYVTAIDNQGLRSVDPPSAEAAGGKLYSFYIYQPNVQTLDITFEEGPGNIPLDHSPSPAQVVLAKMMPTYSTDAKQGTYSLALSYSDWGAATPAAADSNWIEVASPFLSAQEFTVSAWLKPDTLVHAIRVINLPGDSTDYFNNNYEFEVRSMTGGFGWVGRYSAPDGTLYNMQDPTPINVGHWYHLTWERMNIGPDSGVVALEVRDENNNLEFLGRMDGKKAPLMGGATTPGARLRIGKGNNGAANPFWFIPPFQGNIDAVTVTNYPSSGITDVKGEPGKNLPGVFALHQNYPNPFNPSTTIRFEIPRALPTTLVVYDILGRKVRTVVSDVMHAGTHVVSWDGRNDAGFSVATGTYIYKLTAGSMTKSQKMMLLK